jgi:hypothetical protein
VATDLYIRSGPSVLESLGGAVNVLLGEGANPRATSLGVGLDDHKPSLINLPTKLVIGLSQLVTASSGLRAVAGESRGHWGAYLNRLLCKTSLDKQPNKGKEVKRKHCLSLDRQEKRRGGQGGLRLELKRQEQDGLRSSQGASASL